MNYSKHAESGHMDTSSCIGGDSMYLEDCSVSCLLNALLSCWRLGPPSSSTSREERTCNVTLKVGSCAGESALMSERLSWVISHSSKLGSCAWLATSMVGSKSKMPRNTASSKS